jgi:hypothetical protein
MPAPVGDDGHAAPARADGKRGEQVGHLPHAVHEVDPGRPAGGRHHRGVAGQRAGVRVRAARGGAAGADGEEHHGRARGHRGVRGAREGAPVEEVLAVHGDDLRPRVGGIGLQQVGRGQVGLVAQRGEARDADPALLEEQAQLERHVAALGDDADRARGHGRGGELEALGGVGDAEAVGAEQHRPGGADPVHERRLTRRPLLPQLGEARGDGDDGLGAGGQRVVHGGLEAGRGHGEDDEVDGLADVGHPAVGRLAQHALAAPVDQVDRPGVARGEGLGADPVAVLRRVVARADDGDRARREQRRQIARAGSG